MRVPVKLLGFVFWLFLFNCGQCQECPREDITLEDTEQAAKASYKDGETVRVNCMSGFTGMYRLKCENGIWKTTSRRPCQKKKCSHPGDTPNGNFIITQGSEFVFGATVLYTCKKGFEMTSRINQRTCRAQGWDNTVPICEAVKCPAIQTDKGVTASGNTEEGSYGDVIHFECVFPDKKLDGSSDIHCEETGKWSDSVPTCKEITCTAPVILNGVVIEQVREYQKDAVLKYRCFQGFKPREGSPRCTKFGWTLNPECDEVTCVLKSTTFGVKKINPAGKTIFRAGEKVDITCTEKYWFSTKESINSFTCQDDGQWDHEPVCEEIMCEVPRDQHVEWLYYYFNGDKKLGVKKTYRCESGYDQMAVEATCTRDGWTPNPLCAEKMCAAPNIPNAEIVGDKRPNYRISSRIKYKCNTGFEPEQHVHITCNSWTEWTGIRQCTAKQNLCPDIFVENGLIYNNNREEKFIYSCNTGYKTFNGNWWDSLTCSRGSLSEEPRCIPVEECGALPSVHHGKLKQTILDQETVEVECDSGFIPTQRFIKCINGTWETPVCKGVHCKIPPKVENAFITSKPEEFYVNGSRVTYTCQKTFSMNGKSTILCHNGTWEEPPTCKEPTCSLNTTVEDLTIERIPDIDGPVRGGHKLIFSCNRQGLKLKGQKEIICQSNGEWSSPFPKCEEVMCVANLPANMRSDRHPGPKVSIRSGDTITLSCVREGLELQGQSKISCLASGEWNAPFPKCVGEKCGPPPKVDFADTTEMQKNEYDSEEIVEYICFFKYTLDQRYPYSKYLTCDQGEWRGNIKCLKPCTVTVDEMDKRGIQLKWGGRQKIFSPHEDRITFACQWRKYLTVNDLIQTCNDGVMILPKCE